MPHLTVRSGRKIPPEVLRDEFCDLATDPGERQPLQLGRASSGLRREVIACLTRALREARTPTPARLSPELAEKLRALGYLN